MNSVRYCDLEILSLHELRQIRATLADQVWLSVSERQRILGHDSAAMTLHYTKADLETVRGRINSIGASSKLTQLTGCHPGDGATQGQDERGGRPDETCAMSGGLASEGK